jgi:antitoxin component of MazEF toxin-antitoxin module
MSKPLKIRKIGTSLGIILPKELLAELGVEFSPYDPDFEQALKAGREFMRRYPNAMKKLAEG